MIDADSNAGITPREGDFAMSQIEDFAEWARSRFEAAISGDGFEAYSHYSISDAIVLDVAEKALSVGDPAIEVLVGFLSQTPAERYLDEDYRPEDLHPRSRAEAIVRAAFETLVYHIKGAAIAPLCRALSDGDFSARLTIVVALREIGDPTAATFLAQNLVRADRNLAIEIIQALQKLADPGTIADLIPFLKDDDLSEYALAALIAIGAPAIDALFEALPSMPASLRSSLYDYYSPSLRYDLDLTVSMLPLVVHGIEDSDGDLTMSTINRLLEGLSWCGSGEKRLYSLAVVDAIVEELIVRVREIPPVHYNARMIIHVFQVLTDMTPSCRGEILTKLQDSALNGDSATRERAVSVARGYDAQEFAARVKQRVAENPAAAKEIMRILGGSEATAFFTELQTDLQQEALERYREPLQELEKTGLQRWEELTRQTRQGFYLNMGMSLTLFLVGTGIIVWGLWLLTRSDDLTQQIGGAILSAVAALATTYSGRFWKDPVEHIQNFSAQQARLQVAFIGYMNRIGQLRLVFESDFAKREMSPEMIERHQRLLNEAIDQASRQLSTGSNLNLHA